MVEGLIHLDIVSYVSNLLNGLQKLSVHIYEHAKAGTDVVLRSPVASSRAFLFSRPGRIAAHDQGRHAL